MTQEDEVDERAYRVVMNHEAQYSIWPVDRELPAGWAEEGTKGSKQGCLDHIGVVWTDMRPLSLRLQMEGRNLAGDEAPDDA